MKSFMRLLFDLIHKILEKVHRSQRNNPAYDLRRQLSQELLLCFQNNLNTFYCLYKKWLFILSIYCYILYLLPETKPVFVKKCVICCWNKPKKKYLIKFIPNFTYSNCVYVKVIPRVFYWCWPVIQWAYKYDSRKSIISRQPITLNIDYIIGLI